MPTRNIVSIDANYGQIHWTEFPPRSQTTLITAPKNLAIAYTLREIRPAFALLLELDERLGLVVGRTNEALVGQMRMAWWRDVISKDVDARPSGEPLIAGLPAVEAQHGRAQIASSMAKIIDAWDLLLAQEDWTEEILLSHSNLRAEGIFGAFTHLNKLEASDRARLSGRHWALHDLAIVSGHDVNAAINTLSEPPKLPKSHRPLSLLLMMARQQNSGAGRLAGLRLAWHGLTGL